MELLEVQTESQFNNSTEWRLIILNQERGRTRRTGRWRKAETKPNSDKVKDMNSAYFVVGKRQGFSVGPKSYTMKELKLCLL